MKTTFHILQWFFLGMIATCGLLLTIGGAWIHNPLSIIIGVMALMFPVITWSIDSKRQGK